MKIACIIPSRYESTLRLIHGKTLIRRVYERASLARVPDAVLIATDH